MVSNSIIEGHWRYSSNHWVFILDQQKVN